MNLEQIRTLLLVSPFSHKLLTKDFLRRLIYFQCCLFYRYLHKDKRSKQKITCWRQDVISDRNTTSSQLFTCEMIVDCMLLWHSS